MIDVDPLDVVGIELTVEFAHAIGAVVDRGRARGLVAGRFDLAASTVASGWASPAMPAYYARDLVAEQDAMAQLLRIRERRT